MTKIVKMAIFRSVGLGFFCFLGLAGSCFAEENSERLNNPFLLPQTTFVVGNIQSTVRVISGTTDTYTFDSGNLNFYGFDIEVNALKFMNIGAFFKVENLKTPSDFAFLTLIGGFTRFFYAPDFLQSKPFAMNIFTRLDLGGGPMLVNNVVGMVGQGIVHVGVEAYFSKWFGVNLSYGQLFEYGKQTAQGSSTFSNTGKVVLVGLKTTFF